jgi:RNA polymerase sigma factor (sigma-70 family)
MVIEELTTVADERTRPSSFEELFLTERVRLYRALCVLTGDRSEAEDLAQDAFVRVLAAWDRVGTVDDPVGYLYRTALNGARSRYRRSLLAVQRQLRPREDRDELDLAEDRAEIVRSLENLTHKQRASVVLLDLLDMTSDEAATALGMSAGAVRTQASRGRAAMRRQKGADDG